MCFIQRCISIPISHISSAQCGLVAGTAPEPCKCEGLGQQRQSGSLQVPVRQWNGDRPHAATPCTEKKLSLLLCTTSFLS